MKKICYLLLLSVSLSHSQTIDIIDFEVNEPVNQSFASGTRFDFEFKIKGDYTYSTYGHHQIDIFIYKGNNTSSSNELGRIYWNREDDYDIIYPTYGTKTMWLTSLKSYATNPGQVFTMKVQYAGLTETYTYTYPNPDNDGDGVPDNEDDCPNEVGPASNNGCPGDPELSINLLGSNISSDCFNCESSFQYMGTDRHFLNSSGGIASINVFVQNQGEASSSSSTIGYYISANSTFESSSDTRIKTANVGSIAADGGTYVSTSLFGYDFNGVGGNFWLLIRVDDSESNDESNENNNVYALRFAINY